MQSSVADYEEAGVGIVVVTYDAPELQQAFVDASGVTYPFISDIDTATMTALGILNPGPQPGEPAYGIPHPGVFIVGTDIESFRERVDGPGTLRYALEVLE